MCLGQKLFWPWSRLLLSILLEGVKAKVLEQGHVSVGCRVGLADGCQKWLAGDRDHAKPGQPSHDGGWVLRQPAHLGHRCVGAWCAYSAILLGSSLSQRMEKVSRYADLRSVQITALS